MGLLFGSAGAHIYLESGQVAPPSICSSLLLMISWRLPYLAKGPTSKVAQEMTQIVAYSSPTWTMVPPPAIPILCQMEFTSVQISYLWFPGGYHNVSVTSKPDHPPRAIFLMGELPTPRAKKRSKPPPAGL